MRKKSKDFSQASASSFDHLLAGFTDALEDNSSQIVNALQQLKGKKLDTKDKKALSRLGRELKSLDKDLDSLGDFKGFGGFDGF